MVKAMPEEQRPDRKPSTKTILLLICVMIAVSPGGRRGDLYSLRCRPDTESPIDRNGERPRALSRRRLPQQPCRRYGIFLQSVKNTINHAAHRALGWRYRRIALVPGTTRSIILRYATRCSKAPSIPFSAAEPMRLALAKQSGIVGLDHRGATVLAAFEPVADLDLGLVVKIDLEEIREPFVRAALIVTIIALSAIGGGATIFSKIAFPLARRIESDKALLRLLEGKYESIVEDHPGLIRRFTPDGTLSFANRYAATFGKPPEHRRNQYFRPCSGRGARRFATVVDDLLRTPHHKPRKPNHLEPVDTSHDGPATVSTTKDLDGNSILGTYHRSSRGETGVVASPKSRVVGNPRRRHRP